MAIGAAIIAVHRLRRVREHRERVARERRLRGSFAGEQCLILVLSSVHNGPLETLLWFVFVPYGVLLAHDSRSPEDLGASPAQNTLVSWLDPCWLQQVGAVSQRFQGVNALVYLCAASAVTIPTFTDFDLSGDLMPLVCVLLLGIGSPVCLRSFIHRGLIANLQELGSQWAASGGPRLEIREDNETRSRWQLSASSAQQNWLLPERLNHLNGLAAQYRNLNPLVYFTIALAIGIPAFAKTAPLINCIIVVNIFIVGVFVPTWQRGKMREKLVADLQQLATSWSSETGPRMQVANEDDGSGRWQIYVKLTPPHAWVSTRSLPIGMISHLYPSPDDVSTCIQDDASSRGTSDFDADWVVESELGDKDEKELNTGSNPEAVGGPSQEKTI